MKKRGESSDVLMTYQRISPFRLEAEDPEIFAKVQDRLKAILFHRLKFPPAYLDGRSVVDFGCDTHDLVERLGAAATELFGLVDDLRRGKLAATEDVPPGCLIFRGFNGFGTCYLAFHKP